MMKRGTFYHIKIKDHLDTRWQDWFDGLTFTLTDDGYTILSGIIVDQASLHTQNPNITVGHPGERALAMALLQLSEALDRVVEDCRPNHLTDYLFDLASRYATFFENCPVLKAETTELRASRLALCDLTARTIGRGLELLGIETVQRM